MPFIPIGTAVLQLITKIDRFLAPLRSASQQLVAFGQQVRTLGSGLTSLGIQATALGLALARAFAPAITEGAKFEAVMSQVDAVIDDVGKHSLQAQQNLNELTEEARRLGATTQFTALQIADLLKFLGLAGFSFEEAKAAAGSFADLAAAGLLEVGRAAEIGADLTRAFGIQAEDASRVANTLSQAATNSNTTVNALGEAFKFTASTAAVMGQSFEEVTAALGILANTGIKGSVAGTALNQAFNQLARNTEDTRIFLAKYGKTFEQINPEVHSLVEIIQVLSDANITAGDTLEAFEVRAGRAILTLANQGPEALKKFRDSLELAGLAAFDMARTMEDNVSKQFVILRSRIAELNIGIFELFKDDLKELAFELQHVVESLIIFRSENEELVKNVALVVAAIAATTTATGAFLVPLGFVLQSLGSLSTALAGTIGFLFSLKGLLLLGVAATLSLVLIPVIIAVQRNWETFSKAFKAAYDNFIVPAIEGIKVGFTTALQNDLIPALDRASLAFLALVLEITKFTNALDKEEVLNETASATDALVKSLAILLDTGTALVETFLGMEKAYVQFRDSFAFGIDSLKEVVRQTQLFNLMSGQTFLELAKSVGLFTEYNIAIGDAAGGVGELSGALTRFQVITKELVTTTSEYVKGLAQEVKLDQQINDLRSKGKDITLVQANELIRLLEVREKLGTNATLTVQLIKDEIAFIDERIAANKKDSELVKDLILQKQRLNVVLKDALIGRRNDIKLSQDETTAALGTLEGVRKVADAKREDLRLSALITEGAELRVKGDTELARVQKELAKRRGEGIAVEIAQLNELNDSLIKIAEKRIEIAEAFIRKGRDPEANRKIVQENRDLIFDLEESGRKQIKGVLDKSAKDRENFLRDQKIEELKASGDRIAIAEAEAEKFRQIQLEKIADVFQLTGDEKKDAKIKLQRAEAEANARMAAAQIVKDAEKEINAEREKELDKLNEKEKLEVKAVNNVLKQVKSVRDLVVLQITLMQLEHMKEQRALAAARKQLLAEEALRDLRKQAAADPGNANLEKQIRARELAVNLLGQLAGKRLEEAGLEQPIGQLQQANGELDGMRARFENLRVVILQFREDIQNSLAGVGDDFAFAADLWVNSFLAQWEISSQLILDAVAATVAQINEMLDPDFRQSPSLNDVMGMRTDSIKKGIANVASQLQAFAPRMSNLNLASTVAGNGTGFSAGGFSSAAASVGGDMNDNRSVKIDINNNVDIDNVKRQMGRALVKSSMLSGGL